MVSNDEKTFSINLGSKLKKKSGEISKTLNEFGKKLKKLAKLEILEKLEKDE